MLVRNLHAFHGWATHGSHSLSHTLTHDQRFVHIHLIEWRSFFMSFFSFVWTFKMSNLARDECVAVQQRPPCVSVCVWCVIATAQWPCPLSLSMLSAAKVHLVAPQSQSLRLSRIKTNVWGKPTRFHTNTAAIIWIMIVFNRHKRISTIIIIHVCSQMLVDGNRKNT